MVERRTAQKHANWFKINSYSKVINTVLSWSPDQSFNISLGPPGCIFFMDTSAVKGNEIRLNPSANGNRFICRLVYLRNVKLTGEMLCSIVEL